MGACEMAEIRDDFLARALERARRGDEAGARELLARADRVWPLEPEQREEVERALREAPAP